VRDRRAGYDLDAKAEGNPTHSQVWLMPQSLPEDPFRLKPTARRNRFVYELAAAKSGLKLPQPSSDCVDPNAVPPPARGQQPPGPCGDATVTFDAASLHSPTRVSIAFVLETAASG